MQILKAPASKKPRATRAKQPAAPVPEQPAPVRKRIFPIPGLPTFTIIDMRAVLK